MITLTSYDNRFDKEKVEYTLPKEISYISFSYDGGRVSIMINNIEVFKCLTGHDFSVEIDSKKE